MRAVTLGLNPDFLDLRGMSASPPGGFPTALSPTMVDPAQLQQLVQLLGAKQAPPPVQNPAMPIPKQTAVVQCPKSMVGRVIGKGGETIKALQQYTGAMIQIDQSTDPTRVTIAGSPHSLQLAVSMVHDIVRGTFKGFAMLRQIAIASSAQGMGQYGQPQPVYVQGYGFVPPSQVFSPEDSMSSMLRASPTGPLTPPMTPLRAAPAGSALGGPGMPSDSLAALMTGPVQGQLQQQQQMLPQGPSQDALLAQLLNQLSMQGPPQQLAMSAGSQEGPMPGRAEPSAGLDQGAIQTLLAQAGLNMNAGQAAAPGMAQALPQAPPASASLMLSAQGTTAVLGSNGQAAFPGGTSPMAVGSPQSYAGMGVPPPPSLPYPAAGMQAPSAALLSTSPSTASPPPGSSGRASPFPGLSAAANAAILSTRRAASGDSSPLGRYGAIGTSVAHGPGLESPEEALAARMGALTSADFGPRRSDNDTGAAEGASPRHSPTQGM